MIDFLKWALTGVWPPKDSSDPMVMYGWQRAVAAAIIVWSVAVVSISAYALGVTPLSKGFALAETMEAQTAKQEQQFEIIRKAQSQFKIAQIDTQIVSAQTLECRAENDKNNEAIGFANEKIRDLINQYYAATGGRQYVLPTCHQLGLQ